MGFDFLLPSTHNHMSMYIHVLTFVHGHVYTCSVHGHVHLHVEAITTYKYIHTVHVHEKQTLKNWLMVLKYM